jgi:hypothetical protein
MTESSRGDDTKQDDGSGAFVFTDANFDSTLEQVSSLDYLLTNVNDDDASWIKIMRHASPF